ncbi:MAG: TIGR01459 family HAD-type hydrolase [Alphaproteobacteria bacterium]|nr:TIGR01459 family HAD-type hydrolase [Alphaproteobacteria bacterium]
MNLEEIIGNYDAFIVDLWGVIHDGTHLYPGAAETLALLHSLNKPVVFLSNAPRISAKAQGNLDRLNIPRSHYLEIVTSGQVAHDLLARDASPKRRYYYLGPSKDEDVLDDLPNYQRVDEPAEAGFILCTGYEEDGQPHEEIVPLLLQLLHLPMLCINPDMEVVKQDGTQWLCAGAVATEFTQLGGKVAYTGKPFPEVYQVCKLLLGNLRTLCVGDNPATDIKGANEAGFDSLLITGGVLKARYGEQLSHDQAREICAIAKVTPTFVLGGFGL